ncbi:hypothetical protein BLNAU_14284 [Blattamonas nauphoetae]|uniref:Uncharacterized protein n=1 Tax=Blattamonas nauphoetae TaxID=2049346 RepID=A0ABQ9XKU5_9EUKA|nr:hypothetical protein BLNAU_14284 [Blattamonas nauphoetae]
MAIRPTPQLKIPGLDKFEFCCSNPKKSCANVFDYVKIRHTVSKGEFDGNRGYHLCCHEHHRCGRCTYIQRPHNYKTNHEHVNPSTQKQPTLDGRDTRESSVGSKFSISSSAIASPEFKSLLHIVRQAGEQKDNKAKADQVATLNRANISKRIGKLGTDLYLEGLQQ